MKKIIIVIALAISLTSISALEAADAHSRPELSAKERRIKLRKRIYKNVKRELGSSNRKADKRLSVSWDPSIKEVNIYWAVNENLTEGLTKDTARTEATDILKAIKKMSLTYDDLYITGTYPLVDTYGNESEEEVVYAAYKKGSVDKINFKNFYFKDVFDVAELSLIHPTFEY